MLYSMSRSTPGSISDSVFASFFYVFVYVRAFVYVFECVYLREKVEGNKFLQNLLEKF